MAAAAGGTAVHKTLLVGESNPYGSDPAFALYPAPDGCAGHRLATKVLGLSRAQYLERYDRANLVADGRWSVPAARVAAAAIRASGRERLVLLGRRVAKAFGVDAPPFTVVRLFRGGSRAAVIPHPSGLCRAWNEPGAFERARAVVAELEAER